MIATAPDPKQADVDAAVSAARRTFDEGSWWPGELGKEGVGDSLEKKSVYLNLS